MFKKILIVGIALFLLIGVVSAADDINGTEIHQKHIGNDNINFDNQIGVKSSSNGADEVSTKNMKTGEIQNKKASKITVEKVTGKENRKVKIKATLKDSDGNLIKNAKVIFKIKGEIYTKKTNAKAQATLVYKLPKAEYLKTITSKEGRIKTKTEMYQTINKVRVSFAGSDKYAGDSDASKVISKKSVVKKYVLKNVLGTVIVPLKKGDHTYIRGLVSVQVMYTKSYGVYDLWIAVDKKSNSLRLPIATKLHYKNKGTWDKIWNHDRSEYDLISTYIGELPNVDLIKIRYNIPKYKLIK